MVTNEKVNKVKILFDCLLKYFHATLFSLYFMLEYQSITHLKVSIISSTN